VTVRVPAGPASSSERARGRGCRNRISRSTRAGPRDANRAPRGERPSTFDAIYFPCSTVPGAPLDGSKQPTAPAAAHLLSGAIVVTRSAVTFVRLEVDALPSAERQRIVAGYACVLGSAGVRLDAGIVGVRVARCGCIRRPVRTAPTETRLQQAARLVACSTVPLVRREVDAVCSARGSRCAASRCILRSVGGQRVLGVRAGCRSIARRGSIHRVCAGDHGLGAVGDVHARERGARAHAHQHRDQRARGHTGTHAWRERPGTARL
jgi:hypothetical protein